MHGSCLFPTGLSAATGRSLYRHLYADGDRLGILVDLNAGCLLFFKNGEKNGPGFTAGVTGSIVLAIQFGGAGQSATILAGAKIPSGH
jgi:hypothetical protein